mgnify:CR=1 FL=1
MADVIAKTADFSDTAQVYDFYDSIHEYELENLVNCAGFGVSAKVVMEIAEVYSINI